MIDTIVIFYPKASHTIFCLYQENEKLVLGIERIFVKLKKHTRNADPHYVEY